MSYPGHLSIIGMGWLGRAVAEALLPRGWEVRGTVRDPAKAAEITRQGVRTLPYRLGEALPEALVSTKSPHPPFSKGELKTVTALISIAPSSAGLTSDEFYNGLERLADDLFCARVARIIFVSATSVYPKHIPNPREEDAAERPSPRSGISLLRGEEAIVRGAGSVPIIIIRFGGLFGPGRDPGRFFESRPLRYPDDPVNLIHLDDCVGVVERCLSLSESAVINACAPSHPSRFAFYSAAAHRLGLTPLSVEGPSHSGVDRTINTDRLEKELKYQFIHPDLLAI